MRLIVSTSVIRKISTSTTLTKSRNCSWGALTPTAAEAPDIDLSVYAAADKGVSRRHATIIRRENNLNIVDNDSPNGTYLNGQRLVANQPRVLRDGDEVRLGHLVLRVSFDRG